MEYNLDIGKLKFPSDFFDGEEREGFYIEPLMKCAWAAQLELLNAIDNICESYNIKYYVAWGTLLGTIRHKGFIPWDDDIDICMHRREYRKFCEAIKNYPQLQLLNIYNVETWGEHVNKVVSDSFFSLDKKHLKQYHGFPFIAGIDIFILDNLPQNKNDANDMKLSWKMISIIFEARDRIARGNFENDSLEELKKAEKDGIKFLKDITHVEFSSENPSNRELLILRDEIAAIACDENSKYLTQLDCYTMRDDYIIEVENYDGIIRLPFENLMVPVPVGYNQLLCLQYGEDYMTPKNNSSGHDYPFYKSFYNKLIEQEQIKETEQQLKKDIEKKSCFYYKNYLKRMENSPVKKLEFEKDYCNRELRQGFVIKPMIKCAWAAQLELLEEIKSICDVLEIKFWADWGTMLGAVRDKGFIPWDDDMDICMMRNDYTRFLKEAPELLDEWYEIKSVYNDPTDDIIKARMINGRHINFEKSFLEKFHGCPYVVGIDIFPIDNITDDEEKLEEQVQALQFILKTSASVPEEPPYDEAVLSLMKQIENQFGIPINYNNRLPHELKKIYDIVCSIYMNEETEEVTSMIDLANGWDFHAKRSWFKETLEMPFENTTIPVPAGYDGLLRIKYGEDYMTPRQVVAHEYPFYKEQTQGLKEIMEKEFGQKLSDEMMEQLIAMKVSENYQ